MRSNIQGVIFTLFISLICCGKTIAEDSPCGDWEPYKDEKCFKFFDKDGLQTYEDAEKICHQKDNSSHLISIRSAEEQELVSKILFKTHKVVDNIWIGANYTNKFRWIDGSDLVFTNWDQGSPKNKTNYCVQLNSDETLLGEWSDVPCSKKNLVICQKMQIWSLAQLQKILLNTVKNPVPIGFIYVQLPNKKSPTEIWPWMSWSDVSSAYAGVFFRAVGGGSAAFGQTQEENSPRLTEVETISGYEVVWRKETIQQGQSSKKVFTGSDSGSNPVSLKFYVSPGEVRPRNVAIRIWERTG